MAGTIQEDKLKERQAYHDRLIDAVERLVHQSVGNNSIDVVDLKALCQPFEDLFRMLQGVEASFAKIAEQLFQQQEEEGHSKGQMLKHFFKVHDGKTYRKQLAQMWVFWKFLLGDRLPKVTEHIELDENAERELKQLLHLSVRNVLDKQAWLTDKISREIVANNSEEKRTMKQLITTIRHLCVQQATTLKKCKASMTIEGEPFINLPMDRRLSKPRLSKSVSTDLYRGEQTIQDADFRLFQDKSSIVDKQDLMKNVKEVMGNADEVSIRQVVEVKGISKGLAELLGYVNLIATWKKHRINPNRKECIVFDTVQQRCLELPQIIFEKN